MYMPPEEAAVGRWLSIRVRWRAGWQVGRRGCRRGCSGTRAVACSAILFRTKIESRQRCEAPPRHAMPPGALPTLISPAVQASKWSVLGGPAPAFSSLVVDPTDGELLASESQLDFGEQAGAYQGWERQDLLRSVRPAVPLVGLSGNH